MHKNYINIAYDNYSVDEMNLYRELVDMMVYHVGSLRMGTMPVLFITIDSMTGCKPRM